MNAAAGTWPEQNAVDAWLQKHGIDVDFKTAMELKNATTAFRIVQQERAEKAEAALAAIRPEIQPSTGETVCPACGEFSNTAKDQKIDRLERELAEAKQQRANTFADLLAEEEKVGELQAGAPRSATGESELQEALHVANDILRSCFAVAERMALIATTHSGTNWGALHEQIGKALDKQLVILNRPRSTSGPTWQQQALAQLGYVRDSMHPHDVGVVQRFIQSATQERSK